jgi:hypothetical protein
MVTDVPVDSDLYKNSHIVMTTVAHNTSTHLLIDDLTQSKCFTSANYTQGNVEERLGKDVISY